MKSLGLRHRVLAAIGFVAVLQVVVAAVIVRTTEAQLIDQIDARLGVAASPERDDAFRGDDDFDDHEDDDHEDETVVPVPRPENPPGDPRQRPERFGDTYEGVVRSDGTLVTFFAPNNTGEELAAPEIETEYLSGGRTLFTTEAIQGDVRYRTVATPTGNGEYFVTAIPLTSVDATMRRLTTVLIATVAVVSALLAALAWWVLKLGIAPIKRMTASAAAIAAGDLSERIEDTDANTEAGELGRALNTMLAQIETSFEERLAAEQKLRQFIADASHELRTPVATIRGYAELYRVGGLADEDALDDAMRRTEQESQRMSRLIADLLDLAKLDRDPTLSTRAVDLAALVADACADAQATHPDRSIELDIEPESSVIEGDEDLLRQVLANVVNNAVVHTDDPARVTIGLRVDSAGHAVVAVSDDGPGMEPQVAARVTERFYRADTSRSRARGGSGLGLAIAESAVLAHDGRLEVTSSPGRGTTVRIELPLADASSESDPR